MFRDALGRPEITPHNWISEQSRSRMPDEGLGIAAIGLGNPQDREAIEQAMARARAADGTGDKAACE